jgi:hypothetical protein
MKRYYTKPLEVGNGEGRKYEEETDLMYNMF